MPTKMTNKPVAVPGLDHLWGIRPEALDALDGMLNQAMQTGIKPAEMAALVNIDDDERDDYRLRDGVAIISIAGVLRKRASWWATLFGGSAGFVTLAEIVTTALEDRDVEAILLDVDSPGGTVSGTDAFTDIVFAAREQKPVVAFANGQMCSAAYWSGSAADRVIVERTADVGSIGVVCVHWDWSKEDEMIGLKRTLIHSGKYKAVGNDAEPLSDQDREIIQAELDTVYDIFIDTVARNRGVSADIVRKDMADGRIFIGQQAVDAGLADAVGNFQDALDAARELADENSAQSRFYTPFGSGALSPGKVSIMAPKDNQAFVAPNTVEELTAMFPQLAEQLRQQGADSINQDVIRTDASTGEGERLHGLVAIHFGAEAGARFKALADTGITPDQYQATAGDTAPGLSHAIQEAAQIDTKKQEMLAAITSAGPDNPGGGGAGNDDTAGFEAMVAAIVAQKSCTRTDAMREIARTHPEVHAEYLKKANPVGSA